MRVSTTVQSKPTEAHEKKRLRSDCPLPCRSWSPNVSPAVRVIDSRQSQRRAPVRHQIPVTGSLRISKPPSNMMNSSGGGSVSKAVRELASGIATKKWSATFNLCVRSMALSGDMWLR